MPGRTVKSRPFGVRAGFTLLEAVIATAMVGMGVAALMVTTQMSTRINGTGQEMTQAAYLLEEVREYALKQPWGTAKALNANWSPPRKADGTVLDGLSGWTQTIQVDWRDPAAIQHSVGAESSDLIRITVSISHGRNCILTSGWLVARKDGET
jgi:type II secretory pathway pseudopilin PulG